MRKGGYAAHMESPQSSTEPPTWSAHRRLAGGAQREHAARLF